MVIRLLGISCVAIVFVVWAGRSEAVQDDVSALQLEICIPTCNQRYPGKRVAYRNDDFHVIVTNRSNKPQRIWQDSNSWGHYALTFHVTASGKTTTATKTTVFWRGNSRTWWVLEPGEKLVYKVAWCDSLWRGFPEDQPGTVATIRAQFEIAATPESEAGQIWTGKVVSDPMEVVFQ